MPYAVNVHSSCFSSRRLFKFADRNKSELRKLFQHIRQLVERQFGQESRDLRWQSVSAFCFLRFIVPAILHPHLFGLCPGLPSTGAQRSLKLIAKVMQSLANLNAVSLTSTSTEID